MSKANRETNASVEAAIGEAQRQVTICNACRYCEGFCSVFPAIQEKRAFSSGDITQLANLCHNCRACHYACQYASPHEFKINIPQALSTVRAQSWERFSYPQVFARIFQRYGLAIALATVMALSFIFLLIGDRVDEQANGFYAYLSHRTMILLFTPVLLLPLIATAMALRAYWRDVGGEKIKWKHVNQAFSRSVNLQNLAGGHGEGCNFEKEDRYSNSRRYLHQCTVLGFVLCFASTTTATAMHYLFSLPAPYSWYALPKLLGVPGGLLLSAGCAGLAWLKLKADKSLGAESYWGAEMAFVLLLGMTGLTGLLLYALTGSAYVRPALAIHLAFVLVLFLSLPYSKMVHGFFRIAALIRDAQSRRHMH